MKISRSIFRVVALCMACVCLMALAGCDGFFFKETGSSGGGTGTGNYVYVGNAGSSTLAGFQISTAGALTAITNSPYSLAAAPTAVTVSRANTYVYVGTGIGIYGYAIGTAGVLTTLNSGAALVTTTSGVQWLETSPDGKWLISLNQDGVSITVYSIDTSTGLLALAQNYTYAVSGTSLPKMLRIAPNAASVFVTLGTGGELAYTFNTTTGLLTYTGALPPLSQSSDVAIAIDSTSTYLYLVRTGTSQGLSVYSIGSNASLTQVGSAYATGSQPLSVAVDATNAYLYVANSSDGTINGYDVATSSALKTLSGSPYSSGIGVSALAMDSTGKWLLATAQSGSPDLTLYGFDATNLGRIYSVSSSATGTTPTVLALTH
jgi:6-phosphogluconolactonase